MVTTKVSPKFQVVIPKAVREQLHLTPGQTLQVLAFRDRIEIIPFRPIRKMRGFLSGIDTSIGRESDRV